MDIFTDTDGSVWYPLPDDAPYSHAEGAFLLDGTPVCVINTTEGYYYSKE